MRQTIQRWLLTVAVVGTALQAQAQQKRSFDLDDIFRKGTFQAKSVYGVNWMRNGQFYSSQVADQKKPERGRGAGRRDHGSAGEHHH